MRFEGKKIVYIDMDHVLCDYEAGFNAHQTKYPELAYPQSQPGLYIGLDPMPGAVDAFKWLSAQPELEVFILTSPSEKNPHCYSEKRQWVEKYLGMETVNRLIISPHKDLNRGDYLIDDNVAGKGQDHFEGELIHFGSEQYPNWQSVTTYFSNLAAR
ncbi:5' nucleotidase, NT5C type [Gilvimarinus japonicus]|uniref:5' nucleotidase n=1 Tax=Gilvimarinus japonicus TaxID=1796469 RepID=A0ABV7HVT6_9GAMM